MKSENDVRAKLAELLADERLDNTATIFENAPLALIQTEMEAQIRILLWLLEYDGPRAPSALRQRFCRPTPVTPDDKVMREKPEPMPVSTLFDPPSRWSLVPFIVFGIVVVIAMIVAVVVTCMR